jgi:biotin carboxylase
LVTGVDIVVEQIRVAAGEKLSFDQKSVKPQGHAIEVRINAEDPARDFMPSPGLITGYRAPGGPGVRVDSHAHAGYKVPPNYDSLVSKLIVYADDRESAIRRLERALDEYHVEGIKTTIPLHQEVIRNAFFRRGNYDTGFLDEYLTS